MVEIGEKKIEVENDVVDVKGTIEHVETMKEKIVGFGKKNKKIILAAGAVVLAVGVGAVAMVCQSKDFKGEDNDFDDASSDAECDVF